MQRQRAVPYLYLSSGNSASDELDGDLFQPATEPRQEPVGKRRGDLQDVIEPVAGDVFR